MSPTSIEQQTNYKLLQVLIGKGIHFDDVSRPVKIQFLHSLYQRMSIYKVNEIFWVQTLRNLELLGFEAAAEEAVNPKVPNDSIPAWATN
jgi:hypothetical protein